MKIYNLRRKNLASWLIATFMVIIFFFLGIMIGVASPQGTEENALETVLSSGIGNLFTDYHRNLLNLGMPILGLNNDYDQANLITNVIGANFLNPQKILGSEIAFIKTSEFEGEDSIISESPRLTEEERQFFEELERKSRANHEQNPDGILAFGDKPLVLIYNTHNSETYKPTDGVDKLPGKNGGVEKVAGHLEDTLLKNHGIKSIRSTKIHDYPDWQKSYANSEKTVKKLLKENPSVQIVIDIHRDAGLPKKGVITTSTGQNMAKILLIVGSDSRLSHDNWEKNQQFAKLIGYKMDKIHPGLLKAVRVQKGRYNQHLHERSILMEFGCENNQLEEAILSAEAVADVIKEALVDLRQENTF